MPFYVERLDKYGNAAYTNSVPYVVEIEPTGTGIHDVFTFLAPEEVRQKWQTSMNINRWVEVPGPVRRITHEERERLLKTYDKVILRDVD